MEKGFLFRIVMALIIIGAIIGLGVYAYNAGVMQGQALSVQAPAGEAVQSPLPYYPMYYGRPFFGFGSFGFFGCLIPLFLLFLVFAAFRGIFWRGPYGWGHMHHGVWGKGMPGHEVPPKFDEWHHQAHAGQPSGEAEK